MVAGDAEGRTPWHRYLAALRRFQWLIAGCVVVGVAAGFVTTRFVAPEYEVHGTIWITLDERHQTPGQPIQADQLLNSSTWEQLFTSLRVTDSVVLKRRLYLHTPPVGSALFVGFDVGSTYRSGTYELAVNPAGAQYTLSMVGPPLTVSERGQFGDSIGRQLGFRWRPSPAALRQAGTVRFSVDPIPQASQSLVDHSTAALPDQSQFMRVSLTSDHGYDAAANLNDWMTQFVAVAADLKRRKVVEVTSILGTQLQYAAARLNAAEHALEVYETGNAELVARGQPDVTSGGLGTAPLASAVGPGANPMVANYFTNQIQRDNLRRDIARAQSILNAQGTPQFNPEDLLSVPSLTTNADKLSSDIKAYGLKQDSLRELRLKYTDEYKPVRDLQAAVSALQMQQIPREAQQALARLQTSEQAVSQQVATQSHDITQLPRAQVEQQRLHHEVDQAWGLYSQLQNRYEEARLASESAIPDVQVLDQPVMPPTCRAATPSRGSSSCR